MNFSINLARQAIQYNGTMTSMRSESFLVSQPTNVVDVAAQDELKCTDESGSRVISSGERQIVSDVNNSTTSMSKVSDSTREVNESADREYIDRTLKKAGANIVADRISGKLDTIGKRILNFIRKISWKEAAISFSTLSTRMSALEGNIRKGLINGDREIKLEMAKILIDASGEKNIGRAYEKSMILCSGDKDAEDLVKEAFLVYKEEVNSYAANIKQSYEELKNEIPQSQKPPYVTQTEYYKNCVRPFIDMCNLTKDDVLGGNVNRILEDVGVAKENIDKVAHGLINVFLFELNRDELCANSSRISDMKNVDDKHPPCAAYLLDGNIEFIQNDRLRATYEVIDRNAQNCVKDLSMHFVDFVATGDINEKNVALSLRRLFSRITAIKDSDPEMANDLINKLIANRDKLQERIDNLKGDKVLFDHNTELYVDTAYAKSELTRVFNELVAS